MAQPGQDGGPSGQAEVPHSSASKATRERRSDSDSDSHSSGDTIRPPVKENDQESVTAGSPAGSGSQDVLAAITTLSQNFMALDARLGARLDAQAKNTENMIQMIAKVQDEVKAKVIAIEQVLVILVATANRELSHLTLHTRLLQRLIFGELRNRNWGVRELNNKVVGYYHNREVPIPMGLLFFPLFDVRHVDPIVPENFPPTLAHLASMEEETLDLLLVSVAANSAGPAPMTLKRRRLCLYWLGTFDQILWN